MSESLALSIAEVSIRVSFRADSLLAEARETYHGFLTDRAADLLIDVTVAERNAPESEWTGIRCDGGVRTVSVSEMKGSFDLGTGCGNVSVDPQYACGSLLDFLRVVWACAFIDDGGLILHAGGVVRDGVVHVFCGRSGTGKSTVVDLSPDLLILSDETIAVRIVDGTVWAYGTPFWRMRGRTAGGQERFPVGGMYSLVKDTENYLTPLGAAEAVCEFMTAPVLEGTDSVEMFFSHYCELVRSVRCFRMHFSRNAGFWQCIEDERLKRPA